MFNNKFDGLSKIVNKNTTFDYTRKTPKQIKEETDIRKCSEAFSKLNIEKKDPKEINKFRNSMFNFKK